MHETDPLPLAGQGWMVMSLRERLIRIERVASHLGSLSETDADFLLEQAGSSKMTAPGWDEKGALERREELRYTLVGQTDDVLVVLDELVVDNSREHSPTVMVGNQTTVDAEDVGTSLSPIFVVHGHSHYLHEVVRMLERSTSREVVVLREQPNAGRTVVEKFEEHAKDVAFAVVLLTGDDEGGVKSQGNHRPRARQNVIFELGFFFGRLGRRQVTVLLEPDVEQPSDINGLVYVTLDEAGSWKQALARELTSASISVDHVRIP